MIDFLSYLPWLLILFYEEFADTKGVIKICKSMKNRQHNGQKKKNKRTNNDLVNQFFKAISTDAIGFLTGAIRFIGADDSDSIPMRVLACHQGSDPGCITHSFVTTIFSVVCPFVLFLLAIVLSVLHRLANFNYPFVIFKLFLCKT
jgi:hypothetical protein